MGSKIEADDNIDYTKLKHEAEKPASERRKVHLSNGCIRTIRKYHLTDDELSLYWTKREALGTFLNPLDRSGAYKAQIEVLIILGANKWHSYLTAFKKLREIMKTMKSVRYKNAWDAFINKKPIKRNGRLPGGSKDAGGRMRQNYEGLQRYEGRHPFGCKLKQVFACIDIKFVPVFEDPIAFNGPVKNRVGTFWYRLNVDFDSPDEIKPINNYKRSKK
tara:strand:- start:4857 stop:5510 length:654 start_codon:yes stop_codon:yes gene_type:complete